MVSPRPPSKKAIREFSLRKGFLMKGIKMRESGWYSVFLRPCIDKIGAGVLHSPHQSAPKNPDSARQPQAEGVR